MKKIAYNPVLWVGSEGEEDFRRSVYEECSQLREAINILTGAGGAFSALTSGTNTTAAMVVGTGASLAPTDPTHGQVTANYLNARRVKEGVSLSGALFSLCATSTASDGCAWMEPGKIPIPSGSLGSRPTAGAGLLGTFYREANAGVSDDKLWFCYQQTGGGYAWKQIF